MADTKTISDVLYRARVMVLLAIFMAAMFENSRHPVPLWSHCVSFFHIGDESSFTFLERRFAILCPLVLYAFSLVIRLSATATIGKGIVWSLRAKTETIVQEDLYSLLRHPLYTGSAGMILSLSIMSSLQGAFILCGAGGPYLYFLAKYEERKMVLQSPEYRGYMVHVPAFWPKRVSLQTLLKASIHPLRKRLGYALRSEAANVALLAGFISFWYSPDLKRFWTLFATGLVLSLTAPQWIPSEKP